MCWASRNAAKGPENSAPPSVSRRVLPVQDLAEGRQNRFGRLVLQRSSEELLAEDVEDDEDVLVGHVAAIDALGGNAGLRRQIGQIGHPAVVEVDGRDAPFPQVRGLQHRRALGLGVPESPRVSEDLPVGLSLHILLDGLVIHALAVVFEVRIDLVGAGVVELLGGARHGP